MGPILVAIIACLSIILGMCFMVSFKELGSFSKLFPREELLLELEPSEEEYYEEISALTQALKFKSNEQRTKWKDTLQTAAQEKDVKTIFETISELLNEDKTRAVANCVDDDEEIRALKEAILLCLPENYRKKRCIEQGLRRLNRDVKLEDMTIRMDEDTNFVWNRSKAYCLLVPLTSMFYFLPSIQFVFLSKMQEQYNGSQDVCYHNFECSHYWGSFSDFNHVISNISYILYGIGFILIVYRKSSKMKTEFAQVPGGLHQFYIFYSMGFALISEGLLSVCYHICPTDYSLQFDTVMMYGICLLCLAKLYQFRHPDGLVNAYSFFYFLSFLLVFQIFPLYSTNWYVFGIFIALYILGTIYVAHDSYYVGLGRLDYIVASTLAQRSLCGCCRTKRGPWPGIIYKKRFILAVIFCCINFLVAIVFTLRKVNDSSKGINEAILPILAVNLALYLVYYLGKKASENFSIEYKAAKEKAKRSQDDVIDGLGDIKIKFPWRSLFSTAMFCGILSLALGLWGGYYYTHGTTSRSHSPAQSRNINRPCAVWDFYDSHDMWHFLSATAIFLAFLSLLTMDDDFIDVPKNQIDVF